MKKAFLFLTVCFVALFFVASCSKDDNKKKKIPLMSLTIEADGIPVERLALEVAESVGLRGVVRDKEGVISVKVPVNWSCTPGLGGFWPTNVSISTPVFGITQFAHEIPAGDLYVRAEANGFFKQIPVFVDTNTLTVSFAFDGFDNGVMPGDFGGVKVKAILMRANGIEDKISIIRWRTLGDVGSFHYTEAGDKQSYSNSFIDYSTPANLTGTITFIAVVGGKPYYSEKIPIEASI